MERKRMFYWGVGFFVLAAFFMVGFGGDDYENETSEDLKAEVVPTPAPVSIPVPTPIPTPTAVDYQRYNIDYMNDDIKAILVNQLGASGRTAFYLPATGYMNVSRGTKYGVAFAIKNVNPNIPDGNEFAYNFDADPSSVGSCGVSVEEAQSWIERGWKSSGMISGQWREDWNEWHDAMTIYFAFPSDIDACSVKYDFVITKDGAAYDSRSLVFNLI